MDLFKEYPANRIEKERNLELKQRQLERKIRKCKREASMAVTPEDRKKWTEKSKEYQKDYHDYCHSNGLTEIPWRTRISRDERGLNVKYDGDGLTYGGNSGNGNGEIILPKDTKDGKINVINKSFYCRNDYARKYLGSAIGNPKYEAEVKQMLNHLKQYGHT